MSDVTEVSVVELENNNFAIVYLKYNELEPKSGVYAFVIDSNG